jgi:hypothetical protein
LLAQLLASQQILSGGFQIALLKVHPTQPQIQARPYSQYGLAILCRKLQ